MPFDFLKRKKDEPVAGRPGRRAGRRAGASGRSVRRLQRGMAARRADGRRRPAVGRAQQARADRDQRRALGARSTARRRSRTRPGCKSVDPYDLIIVIAGAGSLPSMTDAEKGAHKVHKVVYDVALEAPPFRVIGTV